MARMADFTKEVRNFILGLECPTFENEPWEAGPPMNQRRAAIISTAGLHVRNDRPFRMDPADLYRVIPGDVQANDLVMSHPSPGFDRTGFQQDWNVVFPLDRLRELAEKGIIGSVADYHYCVNGGPDLEALKISAKEIAALLKKDMVDAVLLMPV